MHLQCTHCVLPAALALQNNDSYRDKLLDVNLTLMTTPSSSYRWLLFAANDVVFLCGDCVALITAAVTAFESTAVK